MNGSDKDKEEKSHDSKESKNMGVKGNAGGKSKSVYDILGELSIEEVHEYYEKRKQLNIKLNEEDKQFLHEDTPHKTPPTSGVTIHKPTPQPASPHNTNKNKNENKNKNTPNTVQYNTNIHNTKVFLSTHDNVLRTPQENKRLRRKRNRQRAKLKRLQNITAQNEAQQMLDDLNVTTSGITTSTAIFPGKPSALQTSVMHANKQTVQHVHIPQPTMLQPANPTTFSTLQPFEFGTPSKNTISIKSNVKDLIKDTLGNNGSLDAFEKALPKDDALYSIYWIAKKKVEEELSNSNVKGNGNTRNRNLNAFYRHNKDRGRSSDIYIPQTKRVRKSRSVGSYSTNSSYSSSNTTSTPLSFVSGTALQGRNARRSELISAIDGFNKYYNTAEFRNRRRSVPYTQLPGGRNGGNNPDLRNVSGGNNNNNNNPRNGHAHSAGANVHGQQPAGNNGNGHVPGQQGNGNGGNNGSNGNGNNNGSSDGDRTPDDDLNGQPPGAGNQNIRGQPQGQPQLKPTFKEKLDFERQRIYLKKTVDKQLLVQGEPFYATSKNVYKVRYNALKAFLYFDSYIKKSEKEGMNQILHKDILLAELKKKLKAKALDAYNKKVLTLPNQEFDTINDFFWWFAGEYEFDQMLPGMYDMLVDWSIDEPSKWAKMVEPYEDQFDLMELCERFTDPLILNKLEHKLPEAHNREKWNVNNVERGLRKINHQFEIYLKYCEDEKKEPQTLDELHKIFVEIKKKLLRRKLKRTDDLNYISGKTSKRNDPPFGKSANLAQRDDYPRSYSVPRGRGRGNYRGNYRGNRGNRGNRRGGSQRGGSRGRGRGRGQGRGQGRGNRGNRGYRGNRGRGRGGGRGGSYYNNRYANQSRRSRRNSYDSDRSNSSSPKPMTITEKMKRYPCSICGKYGHWSFSCDKKSTIGKLKNQINTLQKTRNQLTKSNKKLRKNLNKKKSNSKGDDSKSNDSSNSNSTSTVATIQQQRDNHNKKRGSKKRGGKNRGRGRDKPRFQTSSYARSAAPAELEAQAENNRYKERYDEYGNALASS